MAVNTSNKENGSSGKVITVTNNLIKLKAYNIDKLDIEISKTSNFIEACYSISQPLLKDSLSGKKKRIFFLGLDSIDYKNPSLKP